MTLSDFFDHLAFGEMANYSLGTDDAGRIREKDYPRLVTFINSGLTHIHTKLRLKQSQVLIQTNQYKTSYPLRSVYAVSNTPEIADGVQRFILDTDSPFVDDIINIEEVVPQDGEPLAINDHNDDTSVFLPNYRELQFAAPQDTVVAVTYQAGHAQIKPKRTIDPDTIEIDIPPYCQDILARYCLAKMLTGGNTESQQTAYGMFNAVNRSIVNIEQSGLIHADQPTNHRIWRDKWV